VRVALVTCAAVPGLDPDELPFAEALRRAGHVPEAVIWDDPAVPWEAFDAALLRSTWDYFQRLPEFLAWADGVAARTVLWNPLSLVRWNTHKTYLSELAARGAPVIPTAFLPQGSPADLDGLLEERGWPEAVVKPSVSADGFGTVRVGPGTLEEGRAHLRSLLSARDVMVQPYLPSVEDPGERCLVFLAGELSHAVRKNSLFRGGRHAGLPEGVPMPPEPDEAETARRILDAIPVRERPLYARVDLARDAEGRPLLLELELTEPTLFFKDAPGAPDRLVRGLEARMRETRSPGRS
jgi:glutathione synthase/RimK-type ligase-like ATP-grasp enzyme